MGLMRLKLRCQQGSIHVCKFLMGFVSLSFQLLKATVLLACGPFPSTVKLE